MDEKKQEREQAKLDSINTFLFTDLPAPRSNRMLDRLNLQSVSAPKNKLLGPGEYFGFFALTAGILLVLFFRSKTYSKQALNDADYLNIYNALKPAELSKIYEDNQASPLETITKETKEFKEFVAKQELEKAMVAMSVQSLKPKEAVVAVNLREQFNKEIY